MALLAWLVMYDYGWRMLIGLSSTPLLVFVMFAYWLPESPLYLATVGRQKEMEIQIKRVIRQSRIYAVYGLLAQFKSIIQECPCGLNTIL